MKLYPYGELLDAWLTIESYQFKLPCRQRVADFFVEAERICCKLVSYCIRAFLREQIEEEPQARAPALHGI
jgi:hypothetical protein